MLRVKESRVPLIALVLNQLLIASVLLELLTFGRLYWIMPAWAPHDSMANKTPAVSLDSFFIVALSSFSNSSSLERSFGERGWCLLRACTDVSNM